VVLFLLCHSQRYSYHHSLISQSSCLMSWLVMSCHIDDEEDTENTSLRDEWVVCVWSCLVCVAGNENVASIGCSVTWPVWKICLNDLFEWPVKSDFLRRYRTMREDERERERREDDIRVMTDWLINRQRETERERLSMWVIWSKEQQMWMIDSEWLIVDSKQTNKKKREKRKGEREKDNQTNK